MRRSIQRPRPPDYQPALALPLRRATGAYYTPPEVVRLMVDWTLSPLLVSRDKVPRVLDPSCGAGEFTVEIWKRLQLFHGYEAAASAIVAADIDAQAVHTTRERLRALNDHFPASNIQTANTLTADVLREESFDAVIGNPPYINIRQLAKSTSADALAHLRMNYKAATGNFDLYVLFVDRALQLLKPGGRCGLIIPNKWATLDYARACRQLLLEQATIERVVDLSDGGVFAGANVFPHIVIFEKRPATSCHAVEFQTGFSSACIQIHQSMLSADGFNCSPPLDVESRAATRPLGEIARLSCGTAGYAAQKIAGHLHEASDRASTVRETADFITSGNIDRFSIQPGHVRYLNRVYLRPRLPLNCSAITVAKRRLFASPKIVIAGMSRRLEAAWDARGLALGVQVYAASDWKIDPLCLLGLLNSKLLSFLFATRFAAKRLRGGYLAINKGQLARLPILVSSKEVDRQLSNRIAELARNWSPARDDQIDQLVYKLYRLTDEEMARVECHFSPSDARAA